MERHSVFAVCDTPLGKVKVPVSAPTGWGSAIDRWNVLSPSPGPQNVAVRGFPVAYFAVRSDDDPGWPTIHGRATNGRARFLPQCALTGRFV